MTCKHSEDNSHCDNAQAETGIAEDHFEYPSMLDGPCYDPSFDDALSDFDRVF